MKATCYLKRDIARRAKNLPLNISGSDEWEEVEGAHHFFVRRLSMVTGIRDISYPLKHWTASDSCRTAGLVQCQKALPSRGYSVSQAAAGPLSGQKASVEELWRQFFSDPSQWWDHRLEKKNARFPDFKHKKTQEGLWLNGKSNPPWVGAELATLAPGTVQWSMFSWNSMLARCVKDGKYEKTLEIFQQMQVKGMIPDRFTFVPVLNACASLRALEMGRCIHNQIIQSGLESDTIVGGSLVGLYAKCGHINDSWEVFNKMPKRDVGAWNAMILGYVKCGQAAKALELSRLMQGEGVEPDPLTFVAVLNACASVGALKEGKEIHRQIIQCDQEPLIFVGSSLVDMYAKCGSIEDARRVFNVMPKRDIVAWNAMILGYVKCGQGQKALGLSRQIQAQGVQPSVVTFLGLLNACASVGALEEGRRIHAQIIGYGCVSDVFIGSSLVSMYSKCGSIADAVLVFNQMPKRDAVAWSAMLGGYAMHGQGKEALQFLRRMQEACVKMDSVSFVSLLSVCSYAGLVDEGRHYFELMSSDHGISASMEHYACMVDLLGRSGHLHEAGDLIRTITGEPDVIVWKALLGACRVHGNVEMGEYIAKRVLGLDPANSSGYVLLSNIYAAAGNWDSSENMQRQRMERGVKKLPGRTWIEVDNQVHTFSVDDQEHHQTKEIYAELKRLSRQMKEVGYIPDTSFVLHDVGEKEKVLRLSHHSEKLAIAFGLINTPSGTPLRIFKNLRVCGDCHSAIKFITKIVKREITVRDANRFHHFKDGLCSCREYW